MTRDWDIIRDILIEVEGLSEQERTRFTYGLGEDSATHDPAISRHAFLLHKERYLDGIYNDFYGGSDLLSPELTWKGHDLLDSIRGDVIWERIKTESVAKGIELTFDSVKALAKVALEWVLRQ